MQQLKELIAVVDAEIIEQFDRSTPTTNEVAEAVIANNQPLLRKCGALLAKRYVQQLCSGRMKKALESSRSKQISFDLLGISNIPAAITFESKEEEDGAIQCRYVSLNRAKKWHIGAYRSILQKQINADKQNLDAIKALQKKLASFWRNSPNGTVGEACAALSRKAA